MRWRFGRCEPDLDRVELLRDGEPAPLEPQAYDVLVHLVRHRDRVVSKTELLDEVWGTRFVSESTLSSRIKSVRQAAGDNGRDQRVIRTVHGRGYHFVAEVAGDEAAGPAGVDGTHLDLDISFVEGRGGVSLAVGATGDGPTLEAVPSGSYLAMTHLTNDLPDMAETARILTEAMREPMVLRTHAEFARFFDGLELVEPGVVPVDEWRPDTPPTEEFIAHYAAVARKTLRPCRSPAQRAVTRSPYGRDVRPYRTCQGAPLMRVEDAPPPKGAHHAGAHPEDVVGHRRSGRRRGGGRDAVPRGRR